MVKIPEKSNEPEQYRFADNVKIDMVFDYYQHYMNFQELSQKYEMNYNSVRNIIDMHAKRVGIFYKHEKLYNDVNNPVL